MLSNYRRHGICTHLLNNLFKIIDDNLQPKKSFETILAVDKENISAFTPLEFSNEQLPIQKNQSL